MRNRLQGNNTFHVLKVASKNTLDLDLFRITKFPPTFGKSKKSKIKLLFTIWFERFAHAYNAVAQNNGINEEISPQQLVEVLMN